MTKKSNKKKFNNKNHKKSKDKQAKLNKLLEIYPDPLIDDNEQKCLISFLLPFYYWKINVFISLIHFKNKC